MANIEEHLKPAGASVDTLYTAKGSEIISTISVANCTSTDDTFTIYVIPDGETYWDTYAQPKGADIVWNDVITFTIWITPKAGTIIKVTSAWWRCAFHLYWQSN